MNGIRLSEIPNHKESLPSDGRIYLKCNKCGGQIVLYRFFAASNAPRPDKDTEIVAFLWEHSEHYGSFVELGYSTLLPDLDLIVE